MVRPRTARGSCTRLAHSRYARLTPLFLDVPLTPATGVSDSPDAQPAPPTSGPAWTRVPAARSALTGEPPRAEAEGQRPGAVTRVVAAGWRPALKRSEAALRRALAKEREAMSTALPRRREAFPAKARSEHRADSVTPIERMFYYENCAGISA